ncbi:major histocompatibility complex class I-related gene protein-like, partial [Notechis scutatus]|uniref:Major histocompatibility complex class I-related gene protein-like n=1 Tax=Notechis scutatus TaxID=8663 RepID=A0A6J1VUK9_9SAUR
MALRSAPLWVLVLLAVALRESCVGASSHYLKYLATGIWKPGQRLPHFVSLGFVDNHINSYKSNSREEQPRVSCIQKVGKKDLQYWERNNKILHSANKAFRDGLECHYNQSEGPHIIQQMYGCELRRDGSKGGFLQYGFNGRTFLTFDKETLTWVAPVPQAQITQRTWDGIPGWNKRVKSYLEEICIECLEEYLSYGNETLLRT